ncbi:DUF2975 domain-containing protein [Kiloniella laminariae]|uniref:DUF2975 domain-containing protein n=1 Tax=Kiloniella laminariae TaxID=454162 RepID=UPI000370E05C|nr:DUF2975 domain-containing protein [Kiloniella laminariae]
MPKTSLDRIGGASRKYRFLFTLLLVLIPLLDLAYWGFFNHLPEGFHDDLPVAITGELTALPLLLAFVASLLPLSVTLYGLFILRKLFGLYEQGIIFAEENVRCFQKLGYCFIASVAAGFLFTPLASVALTFNNLPGQRELVLDLRSDDLLALIVGGIILLISWVMEEGQKLEDEQRHTV